MKSLKPSSRRSVVLAGTAGLLAGGVPWARAQGVVSNEALTPAQLSARVQALVGNAVDSIQPAPAAGWYEVIVRGEVLYVDQTGQFLFQGHLVDMTTRTSLTAQRKRALDQARMPVVDVSKLDLKDAIKTVFGREVPGRVLFTFEDPRCGFCRRLHQTLLTMENVSVHTFQVSFLGPESRAFNESIWCSLDRSKAWSDVMEGIDPVRSKLPCDLTALDRNAAMADRYLISGTPTLFTASGQRIDGAANAEVLNKALEGGKS